jgi:hypothetical protein
MIAGLVAATMLHSAAGRADSSAAAGCKPAVLTGESQRDATGAFVGGGTLSLDGQVQDVSWVSVILSASSNADGTLALVGSHHITGENGSVDFTTLDAVSAVPTNVSGTYTFSSHLDIQSGSGRINSGFLNVTGTVDLVGGHVIVISSTGSLCPKP